MGSQTTSLDQALGRADAMRKLREVELDDARECHGDLATAIEQRLPQEVCERYRARVRAHVAAARKWNRQLVLAMRQVKIALYLRQVRRHFVPTRGERGGLVIQLRGGQS
jgi:hypothetical protein